MHGKTLNELFVCQKRRLPDQMTMKSSKRKKNPETYVNRRYRRFITENNLASFKVQIKETDLQILASCDVAERASELVLQFRMQLENYIVKHPRFSATLIPLPVDRMAPAIVRHMMNAARVANVGPMAAVAGAIAHYVGEQLIKEGCDEIIIENGGDIYLHRSKDSSVAIFAGQSPLSCKVGIRIPAGSQPCGICTSSGTIGHSLSMGDADSVTVVAGSTLIADAVATRLGNEVIDRHGGRDAVAKALEVAEGIREIDGVVVICDEFLGAIGDLELLRLEGGDEPVK